jgi:hypothetical protein
MALFFIRLTLAYAMPGVAPPAGPDQCASRASNARQRPPACPRALLSDFAARRRQTRVPQSLGARGVILAVQNLFDSLLPLQLPDLALLAFNLTLLLPQLRLRLSLFCLPILHCVADKGASNQA